MSNASVTITAHGVLDHSRAEVLAARLRAAVRNGKSSIALAFDPGSVMASANLLAFLLRTADMLRTRGGSLTMTGDQVILDQFKALGMPTDGSSLTTSSQGDGS